jgi:hypothetical protein
LKVVVVIVAEFILLSTCWSQSTHLATLLAGVSLLALLQAADQADSRSAGAGNAYQLQYTLESLLSAAGQAAAGRTLNLRTTSLRGSTGVALRGAATAARLETMLLFASIILTACVCVRDRKSKSARNARAGGLGKQSVCFNNIA